jgi:hypothetical protein
MEDKLVIVLSDVRINCLRTSGQLLSPVVMIKSGSGLDQLATSCSGWPEYP